MITSNRQQQILELLREYKHVDVSTLCNMLQVSPSSVRRDLDTLERQGILLRTYGGAVLNEPQNEEAYIDQENDPYEDEKAAVAALAVNLVEDGDSVFLGGGDICVKLARQLRLRSGVNVVTNNIQAFLELSTNANAHVILIGGQSTPHTDVPETSGGIAISQLSTMFFDKVFYSVDGVSFQHGYSVASLDRLVILQHVTNCTNCRILLADTSKFDHSNLHFLARLNAVDKVVTYIGIPDKFKEFYLQNKIPLYEACME